MHLARSVLFLCSAVVASLDRSGDVVNGSFLCPGDQHVAWCSVYSWQIQGYAALKAQQQQVVVGPETTKFDCQLETSKGMCCPTSFDPIGKPVSEEFFIQQKCSFDITKPIY
ncbi:hypothetical protein PGT21_031299 [Puccinia graminis f. sp. tritici]|uniref:Uncharacterized protein n=1 Tax=Puccinia graminis f. sp. tritici TaxID=56615 RepID=A0A5B0NQ13_PUCGR|nr:hypothetical protein PGTUg99_031888 [Puccinia graminis f. sp. tritici]KAA1091325.1 hypothetical protein PGT21_031299 [Puccinia graminis f. sp. tritici]